MKRNTGFSLIELMIAVTLGLVAIAAVGSVFIYGSRSYKEDDRVSRMQDELRFAMAQLSQDLEMAGFYAQVRNPLEDIDIDGTATVDVDCGPTISGVTWTYAQRNVSIYTLGDATTAQAHAAFPCIPASEFYTGPTAAGTDVIAIKRLSGSPVMSEEPGHVYLKTNGVQSVIYKKTGTTACSPTTSTTKTTCPAPEPTSGTMEIYEFKPVVWYVRTKALDNGPAMPSLCRMYLKPNSGGAPPMTSECLAQGIEDMQLEFGIDTNANGVADYYTSYAAGTPPSVAELAQVTAVRVHLLARAAEADQSYVNTKTYTLGPRTYGAFNDKYHRKVLSSIVLLRNPTNLRTPEELPE